jgi:molecular chaperone DnaJ
VELPHQVFRRVGDDLHRTVTVPKQLAASGGTMSVETLEGPRSIRIPQGILNGQTIRFDDLGARHLNRDGRGHLMVRVKIDD